MMKIRILTLLSAALFSMTAVAQSNIPFLECHYAEKFRDNLLKKDKYRQDEMILRISKTSSEFFSLWCRTRNEIQDSIIARGGSLADVLAARDKMIYPLSVQDQTIYKNLPQKGMLTYTDRIFTGRYLYTEKLERPQWHILQEKKIIADYSCQKAEAAYLGRHWTVWFSTDIPLSDGPWKLWGLPGLILEAEDADNDYQFTCMEIKNISQGEAISVPKAHYIKCTKEQHIKAMTEFQEDMNKFLERQGLTGAYEVGKDGKLVPPTFHVKYNYIEKQAP